MYNKNGVTWIWINRNRSWTTTVTSGTRTRRTRSSLLKTRTRTRTRWRREEDHRFDFTNPDAVTLSSSQWFARCVGEFAVKDDVDDVGKIRGQPSRQSATQPGPPQITDRSTRHCHRCASVIADTGSKERNLDSKHQLNGWTRGALYKIWQPFTILPFY